VATMAQALAGWKANPNSAPQAIRERANPSGPGLRPTPQGAQEFQRYAAGRNSPMLTNASQAAQAGQGMTDAGLAHAISRDMNAQHKQVAKAERGMMGQANPNYRRPNALGQVSPYASADINPTNYRASDKIQVANVLRGMPKGLARASIQPHAEDQQRHFESLKGSPWLNGLIGLGAGLIGGPVAGGLYSTFSGGGPKGMARGAIGAAGSTAVRGGYSVG